MLEIATFWLLIVAGLVDKRKRARYLQKTSASWILDVSGLVVQGALIPFVQFVVLALALRALFPAHHGTLHLGEHSWLAGFVLNFVVVDYCYYWNHRMLHHPKWWPVHQVHHSLTEMDVVGASRNTLWTSFLILYWCCNGAFIFVLQEPDGFVTGAAFTASLDLWRHSTFGPKRHGIWERWLGRILILPIDHAAHHGDCAVFGNYGANLCVWDKIHRTFIPRGAPPQRLGITNGLSLNRQLFWPFP